MSAIDFVYDDGGRAEAGFKGDTRAVYGFWRFVGKDHPHFVLGSLQR